MDVNESLNLDVIKTHKTFEKLYQIDNAVTLIRKGDTLMTFSDSSDAEIRAIIRVADRLHNTDTPKNEICK